MSAGIATRGERLALASGHFEVSGADLGPTHIDHLNLIETDTDGAIATLVRFDPGDLEAAYAELDARWAAGEAATHPVASQWLADYRRCFAARDWNAMTGICAPDLVEHDHRLVGWGTLHGPAAIVSSLQAQIELVPDTQQRVDHVRCCARAVLLAYAWHGTREGGAFENPWLVLTELDDAGRARRADLWEVEQVDQARTRFDEIAASEPHASRFANAATRALDRGTAALGARDWDGFAALFAAEFRVYDRTPLAQIEADRDQWLAAFREMVEMTSGRPTRQVLATRGDRLAIFRVLWRGAAGDVGPSEVEWLLLIEVDGRGDHLAVVSFDPKDVDAAHAELDARYEAGEGAAYPAHAAFTRAFSQAIASRDWSPVAALCAPTLVEYDHRRLALLGTTRGPEAWVQNVRTLIDLAPDSVRRTDHLRSGARGFCSAGTWHGSRDGGPYELAAIVVVELDERGMVARTDVYDTDQVDDAQARFAELIAPASAATATSDRRPPFARSTMATAAMDRLQAALAAAFAGDDWDAMRALCAPGLVFEDRQRLSRVSGDRELMIASLRERAATGARPEARVIGVVGDRIVLARMLWTGGPADGRFEIEYLSLSEVDASGSIVACILFDPDDARGAQREAWARWAAIDPASAALTTPFGEGIDAFNDHDLARFRATFADDLVLEDHRHAGLEPEDLDAAVARLAELRPDPLRIPPNAATRAWDRWWDAVVAGDRDAIPAMYDPSYQYQDQRPLFRVDVAGALGTDVLLQEEGWRPARTLLATAGDRLGLQHILWTAGEAGATSEIELLSLDEVGPDGRFVFSAAFDPGDRAAAFTGLRERHLRSTRPAAHRQFLEFQATRHDDLVRFRAVLPDDYFFRDRRRTGLGCLEDADSYVAAVAALNELSSDAVVGQPLYYLADEPHASLSIAHSFGTLADGGQFESVYTMIMVYGRDGLVGVELFELDDLDAAKARFEALRPTPHD